MKVEIYSDIACPWCYVGERRFFRALEAFPQSEWVEVIFRPFQLDPTLPDKPRPLAEQLREKFGPRADAMVRNVTSVAAKEGLDLRFGDAQSVNTFTAHRLLGLAEREYGSEVQHKLAEKLFEAHFSNGGNIADHGLLADLAASAGMERQRVLDYLASEEGSKEVRDQLDRAHRLGIHAVPTFVFDERFAVQGAQPMSVFLQAFEELQAEDAGSEPAPSCEDGTCEF